jgi:protein phosphatase 1K/protein phosphatase 1L
MGSQHGITAFLVMVFIALCLSSYGAIATQGTGRRLMEDTYSIAVDPKGVDPAFFGVYDGHGGNAVAE